MLRSLGAILRKAIVLALVPAVAGVFLVAQVTANAAIVYESGDAGDVPSSAQILYGSGVIDTIFGRMSHDSAWTDMYGIYLQGGGTFNFVQSVVPSGNNGDFGTLNIFLFDSLGHGIIGDKGNGGIHNFVPSATGLFYLAIIPSHGDPYALTDPVHNFQEKIFTIQQFGGTVLPGGPAANLPVYSWGGSFGATPDAYRIDLRGGAEFVPTPGSAPEPGTHALLGLGLAGLAASRRRRQAK